MLNTVYNLIKTSRKRIIGRKHINSGIGSFFDFLKSGANVWWEGGRGRHWGIALRRHVLNMWRLAP